MHLRNIATICAALMAASVGYGQSATLTADAPAVTAGSMLTLTASANYSGTPNAVGWSVTLPAGWSFVSTAGPDAPQVGPQAGATGALEWAYADVPAGAARFRFTVKTGSNPGPAQLQAKVFLRVDGKQHDVDVAPLGVTVGR